MRKIIYSILLLLIFQSCTKDFEEINQNPSQFISPAPEAIFTGIVKRTVDLMATNNMSYFWSYAHHLSITGGTSRYLTGDDATWNGAYVNLLSNLQQIKRLYGDNPTYKNRIAIVNIWECYVTSYLVGIYGPIPYSQAFKTDFSVINFDSENDIYTRLLEQLKTASDSLDVNADKYKPDILLGGDILKWKKFANSLRLRLALRCQRNLPTLSASVIADIMTNESLMLTSANDNVVLSYGTGDVNESPYYSRLVRTTISSDQQPRMGSVLFINLRSYKDPRMESFFDEVLEPSQVTVLDTLPSSTFVSRDSLYVVNYKVPYFGAEKSVNILAAWGLPSPSPFGGLLANNFSKLHEDILVPDHQFTILDFSELSLLKAEAKLLGYGGSKTAEQYYLDGIAANFLKWDRTNLEISAYTAQNGIKWNTSGKGFRNYTGIVTADIPLDNMAKIWRQSWINYFPDGAFDAYCLQRRTLELDLPPHTNPGNTLLNTEYSDLPDKWEYRDNQINLNPTGHNDAIVNLLGGQNIPNQFLNFAKPYVHKNWRLVDANYNVESVKKWYGTTIESLKASGKPYTLITKFKK